VPRAAESGNAAPLEGDAGGMVEIRFRVPPVWKRELQAAADVQAIDLADLMRIVTRGFLRDRYDEPAQRRLGLI